jgi:NADPH:quinone reductase-like Zn-dependent oxidoreductase
MRAMVFDRYGEPDVVHLKDVPIPEPTVSSIAEDIPE